MNSMMNKQFWESLFIEKHQGGAKEVAESKGCGQENEQWLSLLQGYLAKF